MPIYKYIASLFNYKGYIIKEKAVKLIIANALLCLAIRDIKGIKIFLLLWYLN